MTKRRRDELAFFVLVTNVTRFGIVIHCVTVVADTQFYRLCLCMCVSTVKLLIASVPGPGAVVLPANQASQSTTRFICDFNFDTTTYNAKYRVSGAMRGTVPIAKLTFETYIHNSMIGAPGNQYAPPFAV